ncbi:MAG TPA: hypothetical protein V6C52_13395 [Coleofasciculaceae cyanobacterium]|jgi:hypothetical protein
MQLLNSSLRFGQLNQNKQPVLKEVLRNSYSLHHAGTVAGLGEYKVEAYDSPCNWEDFKRVSDDFAAQFNFSNQQGVSVILSHQGDVTFVATSPLENENFELFMEGKAKLMPFSPEQIKENEAYVQNLPEAQKQELKQDTLELKRIFAQEMRNAQNREENDPPRQIDHFEASLTPEERRGLKDWWETQLMIDVGDLIIGPDGKAILKA